MKVQMTKLGTNKTLVIEADRIAIKTPELHDYAIEATIDEGDSPIRVIAASGDIPVKQLRLVRKSTYRVKAFKSRGTGPYDVPSHERTKPVRLTTYRRKLTEEQKKKLSEANKRFYASPKGRQVLLRREKGKAERQRARV